MRAPQDKKLILVLDMESYSKSVEQVDPDTLIPLLVEAGKRMRNPFNSDNENQKRYTYACSRADSPIIFRPG